MFKVYVFGLLLVMTAVHSAKAAPKIVEESQLTYTDLRDGQTNWMQMALQILPVAEASKIPRYMDIYNIANGDLALIRNLVVVRSSFYLPLGVAEIRTRMASPQSLSKYSKKLKISQCTPAECTGEIKTTFKSLSVSLRYGTLTKENATGAWAIAFEALHQPDLVSAQEFTEIESVFQQGGTYTAFYKMSENLTWAQSYQVFSVKQSAYDNAKKIPFLNLDKLIRGTIRDMLLDVRASILQGQDVGFLMIPTAAARMPAANDYDKDLYRQKSYKLDDPEGDAAMIKRAQVVPKNAFKALFEDDKFTSKDDPWKPEEWETQDPLAGKGLEPKKPFGPSIQGREKPIKIDEFGQMLNEVLREEAARGLNITYGTVHRWSPRTLQVSKSPVLTFSKIFVALTMGFTYRFMTTDHERDLWSWIMTNNYNSITFPELFRASLRLNNGDVYLSLLTVENLLAANWRYGERETLPATKRLRPITSGYNYDDDKFGTWYHFFGMIIYGYTTGSGVRSNFVGRGEAIGSNALSPGVNKTQKQWFNKLGGYVGDTLADSVKTASYLKAAPNVDVLKEDYYLDRSEDFRDRLPIQQSAVLSIKYRKDLSKDSIVLRATNSGDTDFTACKVEIMADRGAGFYARFKYTLPDVSFKAGQEVALNIAEAPRGVRIFVTSCEKGVDQALEYKDPTWKPKKKTTSP